MEIIIFLMGVIICFITYKWYQAIKKNKELIRTINKKNGGGNIDIPQDKPENQIT